VVRAFPFPEEYNTSLKPAEFLPRSRWSGWAGWTAPISPQPGENFAAQKNLDAQITPVRASVGYRAIFLSSQNFLAPTCARHLSILTSMTAIRLSPVLWRHTAGCSLVIISISKYNSLTRMITKQRPFGSTTCSPNAAIRMLPIMVMRARPAPRTAPSRPGHLIYSTAYKCGHLTLNRMLPIWHPATED
jgi:hypothetical protein